MWQQDYGRVDRALFLRDSRTYRLRLLGRKLFVERAAWIAVGICAAYVLGRML